MKMSKNSDSVPVLPAKLSIALAMLIMMAFGYLLAQHFAQEQHRAAVAAEQSVKLLASENDELVTTTHQLQVQLALLQEKNDQLLTAIEKYQQEQSELLNIVSLYERIIAPETTQEGFALEQLTVTETASTRLYRMSFILLQQRQNKAVIKGNLDLSIAGSLAGQPATITSGSEHLQSAGPMFYRFKFFQSGQLEFSMPEDFIPEFIDVETQVYQYTTLRGTYKKRFAWTSVFKEK